MSSTQKNFALPLAFIGIMFFAIGFALGINSVLIPVLQGSLGITSAESYLIIAATFVPFLIFGYPASMTIKAIGYKHTMALSFAMFAVAFGLYIPSASQESFPLFLVASFVSGTANAFLQASVNPYITILGPLDSAAKRISIMGICNNSSFVPRFPDRQGSERHYRIGLIHSLLCYYCSIYYIRHHLTDGSAA